MWRYYLGMGVENIWLIDPRQRAAYRFGASGLSPVDPTSLTVAGTPISVDLSGLFARMDRKAASRKQL